MAEGEQDGGEATEASSEAATPKKKGIMGPLMIGLALALLLGGGAAYAVMSGLVPLGDEQHAGEKDGDGHGEKHADKDGRGEAEAKEPPVFVTFEPLTITLTHGGAPRQLRLALSVETSKDYAEKVELMKPRMLDALNTLLRAMHEKELTEPAGLDRLRAQMLRRVRIAADPTAVKDLLVTEFVVF